MQLRLARMQSWRPWLACNPAYASVLHLSWVVLKPPRASWIAYGAAPCCAVLCLRMYARLCTEWCSSALCVCCLLPGQTAEGDTHPQSIRNAPDGTVRHTKGCNCKKSSCLKKYCECFQGGIFCTEICKCVDCKNFDVSGSWPGCRSEGGPAGQGQGPLEGLYGIQARWTLCQTSVASTRNQHWACPGRVRRYGLAHP